MDHLDYVVATHPDADHIGGLDEVLAGMPFGVAIVSPKTKDTTVYSRLIAAIQAAGVQPTVAAAGSVLIDDGNLEVDVLGPLKTYDCSNDSSVVLTVTSGDIDFLLMGDAEAEGDFLRSGVGLQAEVLKVGHHGSSSSSTTSFLAAADPDYAVISVGAGNSYGHPTASTLAALSAAGATVYRTDLNGTIIATATEHSVWFDTAKAGEGSGGTGGAGGGGGTSSPSTIVYVTETGTKYHRAGCRYLSHSSILMTLDQAKGQRLHAVLGVQAAGVALLLVTKQDEVHDYRAAN